MATYENVGYNPDWGLIKITSGRGYVVPLDKIIEQSYKCTMSTMDKDSYRDANGVLHRTVVMQTVHLSFSTRDIMKGSTVHGLWSNLQACYVTGHESEKKVQAFVFVPEFNAYKKFDFYIPDIEMTIDKIVNSEREVYYKPFTLELIGYGGQITN